MSKYTTEDLWFDTRFNNNCYVSPFDSSASTHTIESFQPIGLSARIEAIFCKDNGMSGVIDSFRIQIKEKGKRGGQVYDFGDVEPEQLFYLGVWLQEIAEHFDINKESEMIKQKEKLNK